jgi:hypothetical protein
MEFQKRDMTGGGARCCSFCGGKFGLSVKEILEHRIAHLREAVRAIEDAADESATWPAAAPKPTLQLANDPAVISENPDKPEGKTLAEHLQGYVDGAVDDVMSGRVTATLTSNVAAEMPEITEENRRSFVGWRIEYSEKTLHVTEKSPKGRWRKDATHGTIRSIDIVRSKTCLAKKGSYSFATAIVKWDALKDGKKYPDSPVFFIEELWNKSIEYGWVIYAPEESTPDVQAEDIIEEHKQRRISTEMQCLELT